MSKTVSQQELADLLGITTRQIQNLAKAGMPQEATGRHPRYPVPAAVQWYVTSKERAAEERSAPADYDLAHARREEALADQEELKLAKMREQLVTVETYRRLCEDKDARVAAKLKLLPTKLATVVVGVRDVTEATTRMQPVVDEIMDELYRAADVPSDELEAEAA